MKTLKIHFAILILLFAFSTDISAQSFLNKLSKGLEKVNSELDKLEKKAEPAKEVVKEEPKIEAGTQAKTESPKAPKVTIETPSRYLVADFIRMEPEGKHVVLEFLLTSTEDDLEQYQFNGGSGSASSAYDNLGNQYDIYFTFGKDSNDDGTSRNNLPQGVPIKLKAVIAQVSSKATSFTQIKMGAIYYNSTSAKRNYSVDGNYVIKNIPIVRETVVASVLPKSESTKKPEPTASSDKAQKGKSNEPYLAPEKHTTNNTKTIYVDDEAHLQYTNFSDGISFIYSRKKNKWAAIDTLGNTIIDYTLSLPMLYEPCFYDGICPIPDLSQNIKGTVFINKKGQTIKSLPRLFAMSKFTDGVATGFLSVKDINKSTKYKEISFTKIVYIDSKGNYIYPNLDQTVSSLTSRLQGSRKFSDGLTAYYDYGKQKWGFIDKKGQIRIPALYKIVKDFSDGLAAVVDDSGNWGFIDTTGKLAIQHIYSNEPGDFNEGLAIVKKRSNEDDPYCFIDKKGAIVFDKLKAATPFYKGASFVSRTGDRNVYLMSRENLKTKRVTEDICNDCKYQYVEGLQYIANVIVSETGQILMRNFDAPFYNGLAKCRYTKKNGRSSPGFMNMKGEVVILFCEPEF